MDVEGCAVVGGMVGGVSKFTWPGQVELRARGMSGVGGDKVMLEGGVGFLLPSCSEEVLDGGALAVDAVKVGVAGVGTG